MCHMDGVFDHTVSMILKMNWYVIGDCCLFRLDRSGHSTDMELKRESIYFVPWRKRENVTGYGARGGEAFVRDILFKCQFNKISMS